MPELVAQATCRWTRCTNPTEPGYLFCTDHETQWKTDKASHEPETTERQFVRHVYADDCKLPYRPASHEPKPTIAKGYEQPPINRFLAALNSAGCDYRASTTGTDSWQALCPTHSDTQPSLNVTRNGDGMVWFKCWAGCPKEGILHALGLSWSDLWEGSHHDPDRANKYVKPLLAPHLRRAMEDLLKLDDERRAA